MAPCYKTRPATHLPPETLAALEAGEIDVLTFTSSSTVTSFARLVGEARLRTLANRALIAAIGPITAQTLGKYGLQVQIQPTSYTIPALAAAIVRYYQSQA